MRPAKRPRRSKRTMPVKRRPEVQAAIDNVKRWMPKIGGRSKRQKVSKSLIMLKLVADEIRNGHNEHEHYSFGEIGVFIEFILFRIGDIHIHPKHTNKIVSNMLSVVIRENLMSAGDVEFLKAMRPFIHPVLKVILVLFHKKIMQQEEFLTISVDKFIYYIVQELTAEPSFVDKMKYGPASFMMIALEMDIHG